MKRATVQKVDFLFPGADVFLTRYRKPILISILIISSVFSFFLFDLKISYGGDDAAYIYRAYRLSEYGEFPKNQAPLYPVFLAVLIKVFGMNLAVLKTFSFGCHLLYLYVTYKTLCRQISISAVFSVLLIAAVNYYTIYFSGQTYSEAFFLAIQSVFFLLFGDVLLFTKNTEAGSRSGLKKFLLLGLMLFLLLLSKNIAVVAVLVVVIYFVLYRQWRSLLQTMIPFLLLFSAFYLIKKVFASGGNEQFATQVSQIFQKDFYNSSAGNETLGGFFHRFFENSKVYVGGYIPMFFGGPENSRFGGFLAICIAVIYIASLKFVFKKNDFLFYSGLYSGGFLSATMFIAHTHWMQWRLIIIYFPVLLAFFCGCLYLFLSSNQNNKKRMVMYTSLILIFVVFSLGKTLKKAFENFPVLTENLSGNRYFGMGEGWKNFAEMSCWAAKNVPVGEKIASRKAEMSFVYSGREFYPIYNTPTLVPDELINEIQGQQQFRYVGIEANEIYMRRDRSFVYDSIRKYIHSIVLVKPENTPEGSLPPGYIMQFPAQAYDSLLLFLSKNNVRFTRNVPAILSRLIESGQDFRIHSPDMLLNNLIKQNIRYFVVSSISSKDEEGITVQQYASLRKYLEIIRLKYDNMSVVHNIGNEAESSSQLVLINW